MVFANGKNQQKRSGQNSLPQTTKSEFLEIPEWGVKIPREVFGDKEVKGYIIAPLDDQKPTEGIVFLNSVPSELTGANGVLAKEFISKCMWGIASLYRSKYPTEYDVKVDGIQQETPLRVLNGYAYDRKSPQALCEERGLEEAKLYLISGISPESLANTLVLE